MASPPRQSPATSPPHPPHMPLPNPKKRPSINTFAGPSKRRKQAGSVHSVSGSAHPLRQTSFPPEGAAQDSALRSPSVGSDFTGITEGKSVTTTATGKKKKGRGKKRGVSGSLRSGGREKTGESVQRGTSEVVDDDEEDDDDGEGLEDGEKVNDEAEQQKLDVLVGSFDQEQDERHGVYRRCKLRKETVRRIANQTLSQSIPPMVLTTITGFTKIFIGQLVECARDVQEQWAALETPPATPRIQIPVDPTDFHLENANNDGSEAAGSCSHIRPSETKFARTENLGPLLPDHFREALRRYRRDGEGGATGLTGVSVGLGLPGAGAARLEGRRLFR